MMTHRLPEGEPTPWVLGLIVAACAAAASAFVLTGIYALLDRIHPAVGILTVLLVAGGLGWTGWELRDRPVWRWLVWGGLLGLTAGVLASVSLVILR